MLDSSTGVNTVQYAASSDALPGFEIGAEKLRSSCKILKVILFMCFLV